MSQKRGFKMTSCAQKRKHVEIIPKAKDIVEGGWQPPPEDVLEKLGDDRTWFIGVDIETNDWEHDRSCCVWLHHSKKHRGSAKEFESIQKF